jgi:hypothetical protein
VLRRAAQTRRVVGSRSGREKMNWILQASLWLMVNDMGMHFSWIAHSSACSNAGVRGPARLTPTCQTTIHIKSTQEEQRTMGDYGMLYAIHLSPLCSSPPTQFLRNPATTVFANHPTRITTVVKTG